MKTNTELYFESQANIFFLIIYIHNFMVDDLRFFFFKKNVKVSCKRMTWKHVPDKWLKCKIVFLLLLHLELIINSTISSPPPWSFSGKTEGLEWDYGEMNAGLQGDVQRQNPLFQEEWAPHICVYGYRCRVLRMLWADSLQFNITVLVLSTSRTSPYRYVLSHKCTHSPGYA